MGLKTKFIIWVVALVALSSFISLFFYVFRIEYFMRERLADFDPQDVIIQGICIAGLIIVLGFLISFFLVERLVGPINLFIKGTSEIAKGNLDYQFGIKTGDEMEQLAENFNQMIKSLKRSRQELEQARDVLEIRVKARTRELREQAEGLDEQVKARTRELQERIDELERLHKLTVGREMKMIELKRKLQELEKKIKVFPEKKEVKPRIKKTKRKA